MAIEGAKNSLTGSKGKSWSPLDRMGESPMKNMGMGDSPMMRNGNGDDKKKAQELGKKGMTTAKGLQNYKDSQKKKTSPHDGPRRGKTTAKGLANYKAKQAEGAPKPNRGKTKATPEQVAAYREKAKLAKMNSAERRQYNSPTAKAKRERAARKAKMGY